MNVLGLFSTGPARNSFIGLGHFSMYLSDDAPAIFKVL